VFAHMIFFLLTIMIGSITIPHLSSFCSLLVLPTFLSVSAVSSGSAVNIKTVLSQHKNRHHTASPL
jgi:hypothetical protein